jgi:O-antigen/teichoic acid export membrane protein
VNMGIARRSVTSAAWNSGASLTRVLILFARSVLLARFLPVESFGVYAGARAAVELTVVVAAFGMGGAFLHRAPETEDESQAAANHFTLKLILTLAWAGLLSASSLLYASGETRTALLVLIGTTAVSQLTQTPRLILVRRVVHRRLAVIQVLAAVLTMLVSVGLAWLGASLWALLAIDLVTMVVAICGLYIFRPVWRPRLAWDPGVVRYFLHFGSRNFVGVALLRALDRLDDLWARVYLGTVATGFYSRAYTFATYPRSITAAPVNAVAAGTYSELKADRRRLSQAFFRTNAFLIRSGFFLAGLLALIAPEFILFLLGAKWLPMLDAFRLMLVFTLLDPIKMTVGNLFIAVGHPGKVARARLVQLAVLVAGLFLLGPNLGITGVALAVDAMAVVGMAILLWQARAYVDFSLASLFGAPSLALGVGLALGYSAATLPGVTGVPVGMALAKILAFLAAYGAVLIILERRQISQTVGYVRNHVFGRDRRQVQDNGTHGNG